MSLRRHSLNSQALQRDIVGFGVAEKQTGTARQVFEKSVEQAGYFEYGKARLVMPAVGAKDDLPPPPPQDEARRDRDNNDGNGGNNPPGLHPFIQGLLNPCRVLLIREKSQNGLLLSVPNGYRPPPISLI